MLEAGSKRLAQRGLRLLPIVFQRGHQAEIAEADREAGYVVDHGSMKEDSLGGGLPCVLVVTLLERSEADVRQHHRLLTGHAKLARDRERLVCKALRGGKVGDDVPEVGAERKDRDPAIA